MRIKHVFSAVAGMLAMAITTGASAAAVATDTWYGFRFGDVGTSLEPLTDGGLLTDPTSEATPAGPWEFTLTSGAVLIFADAFLSGDEFEIFNFGQSLGVTSAATTGQDCSNSISCALASDAMSKGFFALSAGTYSITGIVLKSPFFAGAGAFTIDTGASPVPVPAAAPLFLAGLAGAASLRRRRVTS